MNLKNHEFYLKAEMDSYNWGDVFALKRDKLHLADIEFIDEFCVSKNLKPLGERWKKIDFQEASNMLENGFAFSLAYTSERKMLQEEAAQLKNLLISNFNNKSTRCYTNISRNPWTSQSYHFSSISIHTIDLALIFIDESNMTFVYFVDED